MIKEIRHTGIVVDDLDASMHFYCDMLGFKIQKKMVESGDYIDNMLSLKNVKVTTVKLNFDNNQMIELLYYHTHPRSKELEEICRVGISHIAFSVNNLDDVYNKLALNGIIFNSPPQYSPDGFAKVTFCRAPEGTFIELVEEINHA